MFWLIFSVAIWGFVHSLMASLKFKNMLCRILGNGGVKFYRLFYNVFQLLAARLFFYLLREFGQAYAEYQSTTPMLIPGLKFGGNK